MKCLECNEGKVEPKSHSIFDITYGCTECDFEIDIAIDFNNAHIVREMQGATV